MSHASGSCNQPGVPQLGRWRCVCLSKSLSESSHSYLCLKYNTCMCNKPWIGEAYSSNIFTHSSLRGSRSPFRYSSRHTNCLHKQPGLTSPRFQEQNSDSTAERDLLKLPIATISAPSVELHIEGTIVWHRHLNSFNMSNIWLKIGKANRF